MRLLFFGDIFLINANNVKIGNELAQFIEHSDYRIVNFEAPITTDNACSIHKSGPNIAQDPNSIKWIEDNGFNIISFANNHILDFGEKAYYNTLKSFKNSDTFGSGSVTEAYEPLIVSKDNIKIGFLAATHKEFGCHTEISDDKTIGAAWIGDPRFFNAIATAKQRCDKLYIFAHAGVEFLDIPLPEWRNFYSRLIDLGADGVIASHPHVPQGIEYYNGKPIVYSLGNFIFQRTDDKYPKHWNTGIIFEIEISEKDINYSIIPISYSPAENIVEIDNSEETKSHIAYLNDALLKGNYDKILDQSIELLAPQYGYMFSTSNYFKPNLSLRFCKNIIRPFLNRTYDQIDCYNLFNCESHRWVMQRLLSKNKL